MNMEREDLLSAEYEDSFHRALFK